MRKPIRARRGAAIRRRTAMLFFYAAAGLSNRTLAANIDSIWNTDAVGNWNSGLNWSTNPTFPNNGGGNTYNAIVNSGGAVVTLNAPITVDRFTLSSGVLTGGSSLTTNVAVNWFGGALAGTGTININGGFLVGSPADHNFSGFTLNIGSLSTGTWSGGNIYAIDAEGGTFNNAGTFNDATADGWVWYVGPTPVFNNLAGAHYIKTGAAADIKENEAAFNNAGIVDVQSSQLFLDGGGTSTGTFLVASGANLIFSDFNESYGTVGAPITTLQASSVVRSLGGVYFSRYSDSSPAFDMSTTNISGKFDSVSAVVDAGDEGSVTFKPGSRVSTDGSIGLTDWFVYTGKLNFNTGQAPNLGMKAVTLNGGEIGGSDIRQMWGLFHWTSGTLSGTGTAATYTEMGVALDGTDHYILDHHFITQGLATTTWSSGDLLLNNAAVYNDVLSTWDDQIDGNVLNDNWSASAYFGNSGTFLKSDGTGVTNFDNVQFDNSGTVIVSRGTLRLAGGGTHSGRFNISGFGTLELANTPGGSIFEHTLGPTSIISGPIGSKLRLGSTYVYGFGSISVDTLEVENSGFYINSQTNDTIGVLAPSLGSYGDVTVYAGGTWTSSSFIQVGANGTGGLYVENGVVNADIIDLGVFDATASGFMEINGSTARVHSNTFLRIANLGTAQMSVLSGGQINNTVGIVASETGSAGTVIVDGAGSKWTNSQFLTIGNNGTGSMRISNGGVVESTIGYLAGNTSGTGSVLVTGAGSKWTMGSFLSVGTWREGTLNILNGGIVSNVTAGIGDTAGTRGYIHIGGAGSQWNTTDFMSLGVSGTGTMLVDANGRVSTTGIGFVGNGTTAIGVGTVTGAGSRWDLQMQLVVGGFGNGTLAITNGGVVTSKKAASGTSSAGIIGRVALGAGTVIVDGAGSRWDMTGLGDDGTLNVGFGSVVMSDAAPGGRGLLSVNNGGVVTSANGIIARGAGANGTATIGGSGSGSAWNMTGSLFVGGDTIAPAAGGAGTLIIGTGGTVSAPTATKVWNNGTILYNGGTFSTGTFTLTGGGKTILASGNNKVLQTTAISIDTTNGSKLDLSNNKAIVNYTSPAPSPVDAIRQLIRSAYNGGPWTGNGITTSVGDARHGLGYGDNSVLGYSSFGGVSVDATSVLIKFTWLGDANLDGQVNINDLYPLASHYNTTGNMLWTDGDYNYDGNVNVADLTLLSINWQAGVGSPLGTELAGALAALGLPAVAVPEPLTCNILTAATCMGIVGARRRRRH